MKMLNFLLNHRGAIVQYAVALYTYIEGIFSQALLHQYSDSIVNKLIDITGAVIAATAIYFVNRGLKRYWPENKKK